MEQQAANKLLTKCLPTFILLIIAELCVTLWLFQLPGFNKPEVKDNLVNFIYLFVPPELTKVWSFFFFWTAQVSCLCLACQFPSTFQCSSCI